MPFIICLILLCLIFIDKPKKTQKTYASSFEFPVMGKIVLNATPNPLGSGARALGIGGAFVSVADDATAASWNPGGLIHLKKAEISIVGSFFSGRIKYKTYALDGEIEDRSINITHLNYFSAAIPFLLLRRNFVFSLNYQHLYEFSYDYFLTWRELDPQAKTDLTHKEYIYQRGSLSTISPALAVQIVPSLFVGLTCNFWDDNILENGWENLTVLEYKGIDLGKEKFFHGEIYERHDFSGFNLNLGFLYKSKYLNIWGRNRRFRIGGVVKTPFKADMQYERRDISYLRCPEYPVLNTHNDQTYLVDLTLKMPISYGLGISLDFSDRFFMALDIYRTHWDQYVIVYPSGTEYSPINRKPKDEANIEPTTQIRLGTEYLIYHDRQIIPIRFGIFYDPEPASGNVDDFYGFSMGTGILFNDFAFDIAYQYRFGRKLNIESLQGEEISSSIKQHYLYSSMIFYF